MSNPFENPKINTADSSVANRDYTLSKNIEDPRVINKDSAIRSFKEGTPIDYIITEMGSKYTYLENGQTQRFKKAENKLQPPQDALVFIPDYETIKKNIPKEYLSDKEFFNNEIMLHEIMLDYAQKKGRKIYIVDSHGNRLTTNKQIAETNGKLFLFFGENDKYGNFKKDFDFPVTDRPTIGYSTFDTRKFKEGNEWNTERHIGNKVVEIAKK